MSTQDIPKRVIIECDRCKAKLRVPTGKIGIIECPRCQSEFNVDTRGNNDLTHCDRPKEYDVVLSGESPIPINSVVLGGLEGVEQSLKSDNDAIKIAALTEARKYGKVGLDLIISALEDRSLEIFQASYSYLKNERGLDVKKLLQQALPLNSSVDIDYSKLRDLLMDEEWLKADKETANLLLKVRNRQKKGWLRPEADINKFPCEDLYTIDQLWVKLSGGKFGFSVQAKIWNKLGNNSIDRKAFLCTDSDLQILQCEQAWCNFGEVVGWCVNNKWKGLKQLCFTLDANTGHLPLPIIHWHLSGMSDQGFPSKPI